MTRHLAFAILLCLALPAAAHPGLDPHGLVHQVLHVVEANLPAIAVIVIVAALGITAGRRARADRGRNPD